ncbi:unnamed protein product [Dovyalis caffra]|uniref:Uncharacterized protein n=1 Tax=Dovyalis caffra TaxID=77055 RepID=A0AAV1SJ21_9ROSI|nr:unnamed protein product [Dovyalis caffra]
MARKVVVEKGVHDYRRKEVDGQSFVREGETARQPENALVGGSPTSWTILEWVPSWWTQYDLLALYTMSVGPSTRIQPQRSVDGGPGGIPYIFVSFRALGQKKVD